ncbi:hypothetical protein D3C85_738630 [compost metagenome]
MSLVTSTTFKSGLLVCRSTNWLMMMLSLRLSGNSLLGSVRRLMRIDSKPLGPLLPRWIGTPCSTSPGEASPRV